MKRNQKIALATELLSGKPNREALTRLKRQREPFCMVVCSQGEPLLTDLVDTRLPDSQGRTRVTYGEFLQ